MLTYRHQVGRISGIKLLFHAPRMSEICFPHDFFLNWSVMISHCEQCPLILVDVATILYCPSAVSCMLHVSCMFRTVALQPCFHEPAHVVALWSDEESSGPPAVIVIPCLLTLSTVLVVALIFYSLHKNKERVRSAAAHFRNGRINFYCELRNIKSRFHKAKVTTLLLAFHRGQPCVLLHLLT